MKHILCVIDNAKDGEKDVIEKDGKSFVGFEYKDNDVGLPVGYDINTSRSLGWTIILSLSSQLDGEYELFNDDGLNFILTFPVK